MIRVDDFKHYEKGTPTEKLLTLVFAFVGRDKASELRFDYRPDDPSLRLWYWVGSELSEIAPPPAHIWSEVLGILLKDAEPSAGQIRPKAKGLRKKLAFPTFPFAGKLSVRFGKKTVAFDILFFRGRTGEHIWIERDSKLDVSAAANEFLGQWKAKYDEYAKKGKAE
jgi:hypothetical protein